MKDLRSELKQLGLSTRGPKIDLEDRLKTYQSSQITDQSSPQLESDRDGVAIVAKKIKVTHDEETMATAKSSLEEALDQEYFIMEYGDPTLVGNNFGVHQGKNAGEVSCLQDQIKTLTTRADSADSEATQTRILLQAQLFET